jgi:hypothetical protein
MKYIEEKMAKVQLCHACTHLYTVGKVSTLSPANKVFLSGTSTITKILTKGHVGCIAIKLSKLNLRGNLFLLSINLPKI